MMIFCMVSGSYLEILKEDQSLSILVTSNRVLAEQEVKAWNIYHFLTSYSEKKKRKQFNRCQIFAEDHGYNVEKLLFSFTSLF